MRFRFLAVAVAVVTVGGGAALAPAAVAATPGTHQFTGSQLKTALVPASAFGSSFSASGEFDSGRKLERGPALFKPPTMSCAQFWGLFGSIGYGETGTANDRLVDKSTAHFYQQIVYQFAKPAAASSFFTQEEAKFPRCRSFTVSGGKGMSLRVTLKSISKTRIGGHAAFLVTETETFTGLPGGPLYSHESFTLDGADVFIIDADSGSSSTPANPSLATFTLRMIARVSALR